MQLIRTIIIIGTSLLLPAQELAAAVVVTYRGNGPNVITPVPVSGSSLDINSDGSLDFVFVTNGIIAQFGVHSTNRFVGFHDSTGFYDDQVLPLALGAEIGPFSSFSYTSLPGGWFTGHEFGLPPYFTLGYATSGFMQYANAYIGVEFMAADGLHYGWIQYVGFSVYQFPVYGPNGELLGYVNGMNVPGGIVDSWAYETTPNTPLFAGLVPEPSRVGLIIAAIFSLFFRRRRALGSG